MNGSRSLSLEALAASQLMAALREQGEDDDEILATAVEGETGLHEALSEALAEIDQLDALIDGVKARKEQLSLRAERFQARKDRIKGMVLAAIEVAGVPTPVRLPEATISVSRGKAKVVITDPDMIASCFMREKVTYTPDLAAIAEALKQDGAVSGACLSNSMPSLNVRRV